MAPPNGKTGPVSATTDNSNRFNSFQTQVVVSGRTRQPSGSSPEVSSSRWSSAGRQGAAAHGRPADSLRNTIRGAPNGRSADVPLNGRLWVVIRGYSAAVIVYGWPADVQEASRGSLPVDYHIRCDMSTSEQVLVGTSATFLRMDNEIITPFTWAQSYVRFTTHSD